MIQYRMRNMAIRESVQNKVLPIGDPLVDEADLWEQFWSEIPKDAFDLD